MNLTQLLEQVHHQVPLHAPFGTRWKGSTTVVTPNRAHQVAAAARIDPQGRRREQFWCDGLRVERAVLLRLTCAEVECPHAQQVRAQWARFHGRGAAAAAPQALHAQPLMAEVAVTVGPHRYTARPARFPCYTRCPHGAHPPLTFDKNGFDLFDDSGCLAGGVTELRGVRQPRLPSTRAAEAFVLARYLESLVALRQARGGGPDGPGLPADDA